MGGLPLLIKVVPDELWLEPTTDQSKASYCHGNHTKSSMNFNEYVMRISMKNSNENFSENFYENVSENFNELF